jgi:hypothetical protein
MHGMNNKKKYMAGLFCKRVFSTWNQFNITLKFNTFLRDVSFRDSENCELSLKNRVKLVLKYGNFNSIDRRNGVLRFRRLSCLNTELGV